jgi:diaminopimelate epimerase
MKLSFAKYHALLNDFIVVDTRRNKIVKSKIAELVQCLCHRKSGIGADGVLFIGRSTRDTIKVDIYNADGSWAEKSGNGLRIAGWHLYRKNKRQHNFLIEMGGTLNKVRLVGGNQAAGLLSTELGVPQFQTADVPIKAKSQFFIYQPLKVGNTCFPVTCLSLGNPHTVLFVENFDFDWKRIGPEIEKHRLFPNGTNVEFVKILSPKKLKLAEWERGVGATGSSGTGAAAAVAAAVVLGAAERKCRVEFESGALNINWRKSDDIIELTGPVEFVCEGYYEFK